MKNIFTIIGGLIMVTLVTVGANGCDFSGAGGIFRSADQGDNFVLSATIEGTDKAISSQNILILTSRPTDSTNILAGAIEGLYQSINGGETWAEVPNFTGERVAGIKYNPADDQNLFLTISNRIVRTTDGGTTWRAVYSDPSIIGTLEMNPKNAAELYIGNMDGIVIKSRNSGESWSTIGSFNTPVMKVVVSPTNPNYVYAVTASEVYVSKNGGDTWEEITPVKDTTTIAPEITNNFNEYMIQPLISGAVDYFNQDVFYLLTSFGLFGTANSGTNWAYIEEIPLDPEAPQILNVISSPLRKNTLMLVSQNRFYQSVDRGATWSVYGIPTEKPLKAILENDQFIIVGTSAEDIYPEE
ncbi:WD40/YVTN/BNR-like repeat-containing protein [Patescibacteria group bacterium]